MRAWPWLLVAALAGCGTPYGAPTGPLRTSGPSDCTSGPAAMPVATDTWDHYSGTQVRAILNNASHADFAADMHITTGEVEAWTAACGRVLHGRLWRAPADVRIEEPTLPGAPGLWTLELTYRDVTGTTRIGLSSLAKPFLPWSATWATCGAECSPPPSVPAVCGDRGTLAFASDEAGVRLAVTDSNGTTIYDGGPHDPHAKGDVVPIAGMPGRWTMQAAPESGAAGRRAYSLDCADTSPF